MATLTPSPPSRSIALEDRRVWLLLRILLLGVGGCALLVGTIVWQVGRASQILRDRSLWDNGSVARWVDVRGQARSDRAVYHTYKFDLIYTLQADAHPRQAKARFSSLGVPIDQKRTAQLRYDPSSPDQVVLSWAVDVAGGRWAEVAAVLGLCLLVGGGMMRSGRKALREYLAAGAAPRSDIAS